MTNARGKLLTRVVLFAAAVVLVTCGKYLPSWLFDPLEWMWLLAALPVLVVPGPSGVQAAVTVVAFVGSTYLARSIVLHAGRELLLAIREAVRLFTRRSARERPGRTDQRADHPND